MPTQKTKLIPEPAEGTRTVLATTVTPLIKGEGEYSYACGKCGVLLVESVSFGQISNIVFKCPNCGSFSELTADYQ